MNTCVLKRLTRVAAVAALLTATSALSACSMDTKSALISPRERVELRQEKTAERLPVKALDDAGLATLADRYRRAGEGPVDVTVTYDPKSKTNTAMAAATEAARIATYLRRKTGGTNVATDILPVHASGDASEALITYGSVSAHAPSDCQAMGGVDGNETHADQDYKYGCTIETLLSQQIANPKDLKGRAGLDAGDGRRQSNILEGGYRSGTPNSALQGYSTQ